MKLNTAGTAWETVGTAGFSAGTANYTSIAFNGNILYAAYSSGGAFVKKFDLSTLPVNLTSYTAKPETNRSKLQWKTASEQNNSHFTISRSSDGVSFTDLGNKKGKGTTTETHSYVFYDEQPLSGTNYYRLSQTDNNGKTEELGIRTVEFKLNGNKEVKLFPNPAEREIKLQIQEGVFMKAELINIKGETLQVKSLAKDESLVVFTIENLASGIYMIRLTGKDQHTVKQFIKQ